jgi:hypothetical protein
MRVPLALAALLMAAGCVAPTAVDPASVAIRDDAGVTESLRTILADVPCEVDAVGPETSENILEIANVAYDGSAHGEIDARGDWLLAARYQGGGFEVVDIRDPLHPTLAAFYQSEEENAQDVKWMADDRTAIVGVNLKILLVDVGPVIDAAATMSAAEILEANITPQLLSEWEYPLAGTPQEITANMHMLTTARIGGEDIVFVAPNTDTGYWALKVVDGEFQLLGNWGAPLGGTFLGPHDMSLVWDELLEAPVLYVANGFEGWMAWDVSDPAAPTQLGVMLNIDPAPVSYTHSAMGTILDGRRLVVTIAEVGINMMKVYDATNFAAPILLGVWWAEKTEPGYAEHNIQIVNGTLYMAHYAQGVFVFDLHDVGAVPLAGASTITPVAHYAPPEAGESGALVFSNVWDVIVHRGLLYVNDMSRGTAVVGYGCLVPEDPAATSVN